MKSLKEKRILWAEKALVSDDNETASRIYAEVADDILITDKHGAAFFYILSARYEKDSYERKQSLYQKAMKAYQVVGEEESIANLLLEMGNSLLENGEKAKAFDFLCNSVIANMDLMQKEMELAQLDNFAYQKARIELLWEDVQQLFKLIEKCHK